MYKPTNHTVYGGLCLKVAPVSDLCESVQARKFSSQVDVSNSRADEVAYARD